MALVLGTNAGFVTTAPTSDPDESVTTIDFTKTGVKDTSPIGAVKVTEIGWWCDNATEESNFEVAIYSHNSGDNKPAIVVGSRSQTNAKGTDAGWKRVTGLNITISAETIYWIAFQLDNTATATKIDQATPSGERMSVNASTSTLPINWSGTSSEFNNFYRAIYALVEEAPVGFTRKIKIAGTFQDKPIKTKVAGTFEDKPIKIKVGGTFQDT